jgi:hypothetical protein
MHLPFSLLQFPVFLGRELPLRPLLEGHNPEAIIRDFGLAGLWPRSNLKACHNPEAIIQMNATAVANNAAAPACQQGSGATAPAHLSAVEIMASIFEAKIPPNYGLDGPKIK